MVTAVLNAVRCEALFASDLQRSQKPAAAVVRAAVSTTTDRLGTRGCAAVVAEEFGHHPDCALARMRWARATVAEAFKFEPAQA